MPQVPANSFPTSPRAKPSVLFLSFNYYLERELRTAFGSLGVRWHSFPPCNDPNIYAKTLVQRAAELRPTFVLSINNIGGDPGGLLDHLLRKLGIVPVTWFVDSPELFITATPEAVTEKVVFCTDPDHRRKLVPFGVTESQLLPLACDSFRFDLEAPLALDPAWTKRPDVSFVGSSWVDKLAATHRSFSFPGAILRRFKAAAQQLVALARAPYRTSDTVPESMQAFLQQHCPELASFHDELAPDMRSGVLHLLLWEANRLYRLECLSHVGGYLPLIVGDRHWPRLLQGFAGQYQCHPAVGYFEEDLPQLYRATRVVLNSSGMQMPRAVNQRVFDVPASHGFVLSDYREQLAACFELDREAVCYDHPAHIPETIARYLKDRSAARRITSAARQRILAEHTYVHRASQMLRVLGIRA